MPVKSTLGAVSIALVALFVLSSEPSVALQRGLGATGDACTVRTKPDGTTVPGKDNGKGECCSTADETDCVIILKPFPSEAIKSGNKTLKQTSP